jgi:hypothetical protein
MLGSIRINFIAFWQQDSFGKTLKFILTDQSYIKNIVCSASLQGFWLEYF